MEGSVSTVVTWKLVIFQYLEIFLYLETELDLEGFIKGGNIYWKYFAYQLG